MTQQQLLPQQKEPSLSPDYNRSCPHCGTKMVVCVTPGTNDSWMYNCPYVECPNHDPDADQIYSEPE